MLKTTKKPHCQCLYEIDNKLPRTKFCMVPCADQRLIIRHEDSNTKESLIEKIIKKFTRE